jgi:DNA invertase Pin-like site-specific DNA recombinase
MRAALYLRVSTTKKRPRQKDSDAAICEQNPEVQEAPLRELAQRRGWTIERVYTDRASGAKEKRAALLELMDDARRRRFDAVIVFRFDRFARSVKQLVIALEEFHSLGIDFVSHQEALDTSTPMGKAMFTIIAAMAELERSVIRERVVAGLDYARANGTKSGRPIGRPRVPLHRDQVVPLRDDGLSWRQIAARLDASRSAVRRAFHSPLDPL